MAKQIRVVNDRWLRVMEAARERWKQLTDEDLADVRGNVERLISVLELRYGMGRRQALRELAVWRESLTRKVA